MTWNSEAGRVSGKIIKIHIKDVDYKGYTHHASKDEVEALGTGTYAGVLCTIPRTLRVFRDKHLFQQESHAHHAWQTEREFARPKPRRSAHAHRCRFLDGTLRRLDSDQLARVAGRRVHYAQNPGL